MFTVTGEIGWATLEDQIRHVSLLQQRNGEVVFPYLDSEIRLKEVAYAEVRPTSLYVLRTNLDLQAQLAQAIAPAHDPLGLNGSLRLRDGAGNEVGLIPPIVEETEAEGMYVLDGLHRTYLGRVAGKSSFVAVHITGIRSDCPAAAYPNSWDEVITYDNVPTDPILKRKYRSDPLTLRRDFSALNGSIPRLP